MKIVIQRVSEASVKVNNEIVGEISQGLLLLIGIEEDDSEQDIEQAVKKIYQMRIFSDSEGKMNKSLQEIDGDCLIISQFTLLADIKKGNRPSFIGAAKPEKAATLYNYFLLKWEKISNKKPASGVFGADMKVSLVNDGPVTIIYNSEIFRKY